MAQLKDRYTSRHLKITVLLSLPLCGDYVSIMHFNKPRLVHNDRVVIDLINCKKPSMLVPFLALTSGLNNFGRINYLDYADPIMFRSTS